jgi:hypothetical protein
MKIRPVSDMLIRGEHCPRGVAVEVIDAEARSLISQGLAVRDTVPAVETADAKPAAETSARVAVRARRVMSLPATS